jgi:uncharacterized protein with GYD domain
LCSLAAKRGERNALTFEPFELLAFTRDYAKGLVSAPEDREPIVRKLVEGAGGKLVNFYYTTGDADFLLIIETNEAESAIAAFLATAAAGAISDVTTSRARMSICFGS